METVANLETNKNEQLAPLQQSAPIDNTPSDATSKPQKEEKYLSQYEVGGLVKGLRKEAQERETAAFERGKSEASKDIPDVSQIVSKKVEEVLAERDKKAQEAYQAQQYKAQLEELQSRVFQKEKAGAEKYPDWKDVVESDKTGLKSEEYLNTIALCSQLPNGHDVMYALCKNPELRDEIEILSRSSRQFGLNRLQRLAEQVEVEESSKTKARPPAPVSKTPSSYSGGKTDSSWDSKLRKSYLQF